MNQEKEGGVRINKAMAEAGICSRRAADELIRQGLVKVNGQAVSGLGLLLYPGDFLEAGGRKICIGGPDSGEGRQKTYLMLNKPVQVVSTVKDPQGRPTVLDYLPEKYRDQRLYPVGRLDYFSEGLLLLTDDGELTQRLTHPSHHLSKLYAVLLREEPSEKALETMRRGMTLAEGEKLAPVQAEKRAPRSGRGHVLMLTLNQGVNRQIRRMCRDLGLTILRLRRVAQGPLDLGDLKPGQCRELAPEERRALLEAAGLKE